jgi:subtilisin family serine protease
MNLSLGFAESSQLLQELVDDLEDLDIVTVTSAGNNNTDRPQFPAHYSKIITVAALTAKNRKASFSNYGSDVDVSAPGVGIKSTFWNGRFAVWSGTSFAAPFATGEAALLRASAPQLEADDIAKLMEDTAKNIDLQNRRYRGKLGEGCINVDAGVAAAIEEQGR